MVFTEFRFLFFFLVVFAVYWSLRPPTWRKWWLLLCSYAFYAAWDWRFLSLIGISTIVDYVIGERLVRTRRPGRRRLLLWTSLATNLGILGFFKYFGFFVDSAQQLVALLGLRLGTETLSIVLPVGISFYTFQTLSYTIDVYRNQCKPTSSLLDFSLFVAFFPQLVAGPIVRARDFLPQLAQTKRWDWPRLYLGLQFFVTGLFKKLAIADRMALYVDPVFASPEQYTTGAIWFAVLAFTLQVYCDFSGYSDMAVGTAHMLGYKLPKNFHLPYLATNLTDFWRRWHMTLSDWLRDYVFIPLGGSRGSRWRTYGNLLTTMTLCGLWHGANWTFVVFGMLHGILLIGHREFRLFCTGRNRLNWCLETMAGTMLRTAITFVTFCCTLVVFRASSLTDAAVMFRRMVTLCDGLGKPLAECGLFYAWAVITCASLLSQSRVWERIEQRLPSPVRGFALASTMTLALVLSPEMGKSFIYFQF